MKLARLVFLVVVALIAVPAFSSIQFVPPNPTPHSWIDAIIVGSSGNGCTAFPIGNTISGSTITLRIEEGPGCLLTPGPYLTRVHVGVVPAGVYSVVVTSQFPQSAPFEIVRQTLIVRDDESLRLIPYALPTSGGRVMIANYWDAGAGAPTVAIGGKDVAADASVPGVLIVEAPPHAAGAADVTVRVPGGEEVSAVAGLVYYDPAAADPTIFEPVLFPIAYAGAGAFGSQWTTESFIESTISTAFFRDRLPCTACSSALRPGLVQLEPSPQPWGQLLYAMRGTIDSVVFASRIRDVSRAAQGAGTEIPVVRESDFRLQPVRFFDVPTDAHYRIMLRVWGMGTDSLQVVTDAPPLRSLKIDMLPIPGSSLGFASTDVTALVQSSPADSIGIRVYTAAYGIQTVPLWGMLSITNNDTQQVTIVTPH